MDLMSREILARRNRRFLSCPVAGVGVCEVSADPEVGRWIRGEKRDGSASNRRCFSVQWRGGGGLLNQR